VPTHAGGLGFFSWSRACAQSFDALVPAAWSSHAVRDPFGILREGFSLCVCVWSYIVKSASAPHGPDADADRRSVADRMHTRARAADARHPPSTLHILRERYALSSLSYSVHGYRVIANWFSV
jgi:hypothetical protein